MMRRPLAALLLAVSTLGAAAETYRVDPVRVPEWKAVYGQVEARDEIAARARLGGTLVSLEVSEGDLVEAGATIATVLDDKIEFRVDALDAQLRALASQLENAESELARGQQLVDRGVATAQRLDQLRTQTDVFRNQIASVSAERQVVVQQGREGAVLAPVTGRVLTVPVAEGSVIMAGEPVATVGGGGFFLRLAIPERHAPMLEEGAPLSIATPDGPRSGRLAKIYPQIENGRVVADVEVDGLDTAFVDARLLVRVPVGERTALAVPAGAVVTRSGLDFVTVETAAGEVERSVVLGEPVEVGGAELVEVLSGLVAGDAVVLP